MKLKTIEDRKIKTKVEIPIIQNKTQIVLCLLLIVMIIIEPNFISKYNLINILEQSSIRIIVAIGMGGIIITKGVDFSAGRITGLGAIISASLLQSSDYSYRMYQGLETVPLVLPILITILICTIIGILNGFVVAKLKIPSFIATIGTMLIVYGISSLYIDRPPYGAQVISGFKPEFINIAQGSIRSGTIIIPNLILYAIIISIIMWIVWNKTNIGKNMFILGKELETTEEVDIYKNTIKIYAIAGALYGLAGVLEASRIGSVNNNIGFMYEIDAIVACVIGGVSLSGGVGSIGKIIIGVLIIQTISYGLVFMGVSTYIQFIIKGLIIIGAVSIDIKKHTKEIVN